MIIVIMANQNSVNGWKFRYSAYRRPEPLWSDPLERRWSFRKDWINEKIGIPTKRNHSCWVANPCIFNFILPNIKSWQSHGKYPIKFIFIFRYCFTFEKKFPLNECIHLPKKACIDKGVLYFWEYHIKRLPAWEQFFQEVRPLFNCWLIVSLSD